MSAEEAMSAQEGALGEYLDSIQLPSLVKELGETLLTNKPDEPISHLVSFLASKYPDQASAANVPGMAEAVAAAAASSGGGGKKVSSSLMALAAEAEAGSDDEDEEPFDENAPVYVEPVILVKKPRKTAVSAESMDPAKMKEQMKNITCIVKSPEVAEELLRVVSKSPLLRALDQEQKDTIVKAFDGPLTFQPDVDIIKQGEIGEVFYLLEQGAVDVYISKGGDEPNKVHTYKPGDAFGELAIMYNAPRAATCRAQTECKLWSLDRVSFKCIVVAAAMIKREMYQGFLQQVSILSSLNEMEIMTLADSLAEETYQDGQAICTQGEESNYFYIIKEGTAKASVKTEDGGSREVATLTDGMYFGEIALLGAKDKQATVNASGGALKVLALDRATFIRVLGEGRVTMPSYVL